MSQTQTICDFWFLPPEHPDYGQSRSVWFKKDQRFDQLVRERFLDTYWIAVRKELSGWRTQPQGCLALIILLDQFPRNMFRGTPQSFATDPQALDVARYVVDQGWDQELLAVQRWFIYLPFEHSEELSCQQRSLQLWQQLAADPQSQSAIAYAQKHYEVIQRFGRFPHRNQILGRPNTPEEIAFLQQPGSSF